MDTVKTIDPAHIQLAAELAADGVRFAVGSFMDITGRAKSKVVPIDHLPNMLAGSERYTPRGMGDLGVMTPNEDECVAVPDLATLRVMPWDTRFVWMAADLSFGGREPFAHCTRSILKRQLAEAAELGFMLNLGVEPELYVFDPASLGRSDGYLEPMARSAKLRPTQAYDVEAELDAMPFLEPMSRYLTESGFGLFSLDAEGGDGQYEFDFDYAPALDMADKLAFFRLMVKQAAKEAGLVATFMPKPYTSGW
ncbi:MAG: glutamine synthetase, partial [Actinomycetota bacterium]|nr:glutamine synthetase [Actinomycetota bacterium]